MGYLIVILIVWFLCGIVSNIILRKSKLPPLYKLLLLLEGAIGLLLLFIYKGSSEK